MDDNALRRLPEVRLGLAALGLVLVTAVLAPGGDAVLSLAVLAVCVAVAAVLQPQRYAALLAVSAWCFLTGFVVHDGGLLSFAPADLVHLGVLLAVAVAGSRLGTPVSPNPGRPGRLGLLGRRVHVRS